MAAKGYLREVESHTDRVLIWLKRLDGETKESEGDYYLIRQTDPLFDVHVALAIAAATNHLPVTIKVEKPDVKKKHFVRFLILHGVV